VEIYGGGREATYNSKIKLFGFACWTNKTTNTHSEYVILIFHSKHNYANVFQYCVYTYIACLFIHVFATSHFFCNKSTKDLRQQSALFPVAWNTPVRLHATLLNLDSCYKKACESPCDFCESGILLQTSEPLSLFLRTFVCVTPRHIFVSYKCNNMIADASNCEMGAIQVTDT
jgi:hypothetical protein